MIELWQQIVAAVENSPLWRGALTTGIAFLAFVGIISILFGVSFTLSRFFKKIEEIKKVKKALVYILTLSGVIILMFGALVGFFLPVIPGILLLFLALILLRRIYKNEWLEDNISYLEWKLKFKRRVKYKVRKAKTRVKEHKDKLGKALKSPKKRRK